MLLVLRLDLVKLEPFLPGESRMQVTLPICLPAPFKNVFFTTTAALLLFVASSSAQVVRQINSSGTTQPVPTQVGAPGIQDQETDTALDGNASHDHLGADIQGNTAGKVPPMR